MTATAMNKRLSVLAALIMLIGVAIRCTHLFLIDLTHEPFRLGGLFVAFADEIAAHNFQLPVTIPYYSSGGIPYAYPPLAFYVEAILLKIFPGQIFAVANLLPPLVSILTLGLAARFFHRWAGGCGADGAIRSLSALAAYASLPGAFYNQIDAAGLAEAFGSLALVVYLALLHAYQQNHSPKSASFAGLGLALCVLSSPGSAMGAAFISLALVLDVPITVRWSQATQPYLQLFWIGLTGFALSAPYWLPVILNHGLGIFLTPVGMQYEESGSASFLGKLQGSWFTYSALQQDGVYFWSIAILLGIGWLVWQRKLFLPLAFLALFSIPRENAWVTAFPAALLVAHGIADVLVPTIKSMSVSTRRIRTGVMWAAFGLIGISLILQAFELVNFQVQDENWSLKPAEVEELRRARAIIPSSAQVIVLGNGGLREWAPYLLQREVLNTEFGLEWQPVEYRQIMSANQALDDAQSWENISGAVRSLTNQKQVYVILDPNDSSGWSDIADHASFVVKMNTPELQVGILEIP
jgi:hypothetical protein